MSLALVLAAALLMQGCYTTEVAAPRLRNMASFSPIRGAKKANLELEYRQWYILFGLIPLNSPPELDKDIHDALVQSGGNAVSNMQVQTQWDFPWVFLNIITEYVTVTNQQVKVTGDIVKY